MYKFKTKVLVNTDNFIEHGTIEWYLNFNITLDGISGIVIHIPDQLVKCDNDKTVEVKGVLKRYYEGPSRKLHNVTIKPHALSVIDNSSWLWFE